VTLMLLLGPGCPSPPVEPAEDTCPRAWEAVGDSCEPLLPPGAGIEGLGVPAPLTEGELSPVQQLALAERFQPAMVFAGRDVWPVGVEYCYESGADLVQHPEEDTEYAQGSVVVPGADLPGADLSSLPAQGYVYGVDCPGDNLGPGWQEASWLDRWREIQGDDPTAAPYRPLHYVHLAWFDRDQELLLIQYWFFYPFNKFSNNHEGDWEHVNVLVRGLQEPEIVDLDYHFHGDSQRAFQRITRIGDDSGGDHPVVFASGCGEFAAWGGCYSGASWPWPGVIASVPGLAEEDTTSMARFLHPDDIEVVLLPEPDAVAAGGWPPAISWLPLPIYFGQWQVEENHFLILLGEANEAPTQPARKGSWNSFDETDWLGDPESVYQWFEPPQDWPVLYNPGHDDSVRPPGY